MLPRQWTQSQRPPRRSGKGFQGELLRGTCFGRCESRATETCKLVAHRNAELDKPQVCGRSALAWQTCLALRSEFGFTFARKDEAIVRGLPCLRTVQNYQLYAFRSSAMVQCLRNCNCGRTSIPTKHAN